MSPAYELGGDFYDFIPLPDDNLGLAIADVSGKGVPASLIMASRARRPAGQVDNVYYLYEVIRRINLMLCRDTQAQRIRHALLRRARRPQPPAHLLQRRPSAGPAPARRARSSS